MKSAWSLLFLLLIALAGVNCEQELESDSNNSATPTNQHTALAQIWRNLSCMFNWTCTDFHCKYDVDCNIKHGMHSHCNTESRKCVCKPDTQMEPKTQRCMTPMGCFTHLDCLGKLGIFSSCFVGECGCDAGFELKEGSKVCQRKAIFSSSLFTRNSLDHLSALFPNECVENEDCIAKYGALYPDCKFVPYFQTRRCKKSTSLEATAAPTKDHQTRALDAEARDYSQIGDAAKCNSNWECRKLYGHHSHCHQDGECACRAGSRWDEENRFCAKRRGFFFKTTHKKKPQEDDASGQIEP